MAELDRLAEEAARQAALDEAARQAAENAAARVAEAGGQARQTSGNAVLNNVNQRTERSSVIHAETQLASVDEHILMDDAYGYSANIRAISVDGLDFSLGDGDEEDSRRKKQ